MRKILFFTTPILLVCSICACKKENNNTPQALIQGNWSLQKMIWHYYNADNGVLIQADTLIIPAATPSGMSDSYTVQFNKNTTFTELKREVTGFSPSYTYLRDTINGTYVISGSALTLSNNVAGSNYSILTNLGLNFSETPSPYSETMTQLTMSNLVLHDEQTAYFFAGQGLIRAVLDGYFTRYSKN